MQTSDKNNSQELEKTTDPANLSKARREQSDPQLTELNGFIDSSQDLEPTLEDGTKAPEKAKEEHEKNISKPEE